MENFVRNVDMLVLNATKNFKRIFIYSLALSILLALISRFTFDSNVENGLQFHHWVSFYTAQLSVITLVIPLAAALLVAVNKK